MTEHYNETPEDVQVPSTPDSINELCFVGEFGFHRIGGPHTVSKSQDVWLVEIERDVVRFPSTLKSNVDECAVLVADGEVVGGGVTTEVKDSEGGEEIFVFVDQYYQGNADD